VGGAGTVGAIMNDTELATVIAEIHLRSRRTYGAPRVHVELSRLDWHCSRKRVARLRRTTGLVGVHARRRWRNGRPDVAPAPDLVNRDFTPSGPDQVGRRTSPSSAPTKAGCISPA
jgi:hypothetical protein